MKSNPITAKIVDFAVWVERTTSNIAASVECVLTFNSTILTIAKRESIAVIVQCVKSTYSVHVVHRTKCLAATRFIGSAFDNWQPMIVDAPFVKRQPKLGNVCCQLGVPWPQVSKCNLSLPNSLG